MENILLISPNPWGKLRISKHNYAIALVEMGYRVYFMNPPNQDKQVKDYKIYEAEGFKNLYIIDSYLWNNRYIDFIRWRLAITQVYDFLLLKLINRICKQNKLSFKEVWNFDPNLHGFMHRYKTEKTLFFIADQISHKTSLRNARKSNAVISVANEILDQFKSINQNCLLINHGLNQQFEQYAQKRLIDLKNIDNDTIASKKLKVGYIGNLLMPFVDEQLLKKIITENSNIDFHFWGAYTADNSNNLLSKFNSEIYNTVQWIHDNCTNVFFHGIQTSQQIVSQLHDIDVFIYINSPFKDVNGGANSHKILEYLSAGKVIVSTYLSYYANRDLFPIIEKGKEDNYGQVFSNVINQLESYNHPNEQEKRIQFALSNTYKNNILNIQSFIN